MFCFLQLHSLRKHTESQLVCTFLPPLLHYSWLCSSYIPLLLLTYLPPGEIHLWDPLLINHTLVQVISQKHLATWAYLCAHLDRLSPRLRSPMLRGSTVSQPEVLSPPPSDVICCHVVFIFPRVLMYVYLLCEMLLYASCQQESPISPAPSRSLIILSLYKSSVVGMKWAYKPMMRLCLEQLHTPFNSHRCCSWHLCLVVFYEPGLTQGSSLGVLLLYP